MGNNYNRNGVSERLTVHHCSIQESVNLFAENSFHYIISNPPYIRRADIAGLQTEVSRLVVYNSFITYRLNTTLIELLLISSVKDAAYNISLMKRFYSCMALNAAVYNTAEVGSYSVPSCLCRMSLIIRQCACVGDCVLL